jgi:hypothetical protein
MRERRAGEYAAKAHSRVWLCHMSAAKGRWIIDSKQVRVNKRDSPRISKEIHIDRKQPLGVSLKGSSLEVVSDLRSG